MYEIIKNIIKRILPDRFLKSNEEFFRKLIAYSYKGNRYQCNICEFNLKSFVNMKNGDLLCPSCGSLPRNRRLWDLTKSEFKDKVVLHFSPPKSLKQNIVNLNSAKEYITSDFANEFESDYQLDITDIDLPDKCIDMIICFHVLEHVPNDTQAMMELYRVLRSGGKCYIQTPFKTGEIFEDESIESEEERLHHFGQKDHVRIYSISGLIERMENQGFVIENQTFQRDTESIHGFNAEENILIGKKFEI